MRATLTWRLCATPNDPMRRHLNIAITSHDDEQGGHLGTLPRCQPATKSLRCAEARDVSIRCLCTKNDNATRCRHGIAIARHVDLTMSHHDKNDSRPQQRLYATMATARHSGMPPQANAGERAGHPG